MSLPETCPFCGAEPYITASGAQCRGGDRWVLFSCDTSIYAGQDLRRTQSRKCEVSERNRLLARVAELEERCKRFEELGAELDVNYTNIHNKLVVVSAAFMNAELRIGETKRECVVYVRDGRAYVRTRAEFMSKFEPVGDSSLTSSKV